MRAGYAEIAKIALAKDAKFFSWLEQNIAAVLKNTPERAQAIHTACRLKAEIVARDEREGDERKLLNLGHTFGHALEVLNNYSDVLLHGEAVSIGIGMASRLSAWLGLCSAQVAERAGRHLQAAGLPVSVRNLPGIDAEKLMNAMLKDKKVTDEQITLILIKDIGKALVSQNVKSAQLNAFLQSEVA